MSKIIKRCYDEEGKIICPTCKKKFNMNTAMDVDGYRICINCFKFFWAKALSKRSDKKIWKSILTESQGSSEATLPKP